MLIILLGMIITLNFIFIEFKLTLIRRSDETAKFKYFNDLYGRWMKNRNENKYLADYLTEHGYKSVAVYGLGQLGIRLCEELSDSHIDIKYIIDRRTTNTFKDIKVYRTVDGREPVDVIIVTVLQEYEKIENELLIESGYPVISLDSIIYGL